MQSLSYPVSRPLASSYSPFSLSRIYHFAVPLATKILRLALDSFKLMQNLCVIGFGAKEVIVDYIWKELKDRKTSRSKDFNLIEIQENPGTKLIQQVHRINKEFSLIHGTFYIGSGIFGIFEAIHESRWFLLGKALPFVKHIAAGLFLYANLFSLEQNIKLFYTAQRLGQCVGHHTISFRLKLSAVLGAINNLGYIFTTLAVLFPKGELIAVILGCLSIFVGAIKIIFDFFFVTPVTNSKKI